MDTCGCHHCEWSFRTEAGRAKHFHVSEFCVSLPGHRRRFVDISIPLENGVKSDPEGFCPQIEYIDHKQGAVQTCKFFPGLTPDQLPEGEGWAIEKVTLITHNGTHLDAPYHFATTMDKGERAITIDEVPLEWCMAPGVKLDFRHLPSGHVVTASEVEEALKVAEHKLSPGDIVLVNTKAGERYGHDDYVDSGCGMGREATLYLLDRGVRVTGTDGWSWDAPFSHTAQTWARDSDPDVIWEGHKAGRERGYCHLEKLHNLEALPSTGFLVVCFPCKIRGASAGWTRAVAIIDEREQSLPSRL